MQIPQSLNPIWKYYQNGDMLDVAGLNRITVLIDRSRTALTEVGLNVWHAGLEGPPHSHDAKEQIFFVTAGTGSVTVAGESFRVQPGSLVYVPIGAMHRTVVDSGNALEYILFNAFRDADKEGHQSFATHIDHVKHERRQQAEQAGQGHTINWSRNSQQGQCITVELSQPPVMHGIESIPLLNQHATFRSAAHLIRTAADQQRPLPPAIETAWEKTLFVLHGAGKIHAGETDFAVKAQEVIYLPAEQPIALETDDTGLDILCLSTILDPAHQELS